MILISCVPFIEVRPRYNGFGGKVEYGELPSQAAVRELKVRPSCGVSLHPSHAKKEECGVEAPLNHCGTLLFVSKGGPEWAFQIELYRADTYSGTLIEFVFYLLLSSHRDLSDVNRPGQKKCDPSGFLLLTPRPWRLQKLPTLVSLPYPMIPCGLMTFIGCHFSLPIGLSLGVLTLTPIPPVNTRCLDGGLASLHSSRIIDSSTSYNELSLWV